MKISVQDVMRRFHSHYGSGEKEDEKPMIEHQTCPVCKRLNEQAKDWCSSCGTPLNATGARESAVQSGLLGQAGKIPAQEEMAQMKAELVAAREREEVYRKEQLLLLQQMQEIRTALASN
jgi:hypothetical protein